MAAKNIDGYIKAWINGHEEAFRDVVEGYFYLMSAFARQMVSNQQDAEELVMNAFLKLWQHKHRIAYVTRPDQYLFGILRREIVAHARKQVLPTEPIENIDLAKLGTISHPEIGLEELRHKYQSALNKLTPRQRTVFELSREQELTQQEIAESTGLSVNTVGNHINAALKVFREEMSEYPSTLLVFALSGPLAALFGA